jgi:hypothetical protein
VSNAFREEPLKKANASRRAGARHRCGFKGKDPTLRNSGEGWGTRKGQRRKAAELRKGGEALRYKGGPEDERAGLKTGPYRCGFKGKDPTLRNHGEGWGTQNC